MNLERRTFLCWLVSGAVALPIRGVRLHAQAVTLPNEAVATLRTIAPVVLPSALRPEGHDKVVNDFVFWLSSYRSGAERSWGYGSPRKSGTAAIDVSRYVEQLRVVEESARAEGGVRAAVTAALNGASVSQLPSSPTGQHVISDFMSFFFTSGPAHDLAYGATIRRGTCRGLAGSSMRPVSAVAGD